MVGWGEGRGRKEGICERWVRKEGRFDGGCGG